MRILFFAAIACFYAAALDGMTLKTSVLGHVVLDYLFKH
jgi:hypothetical protein